MFSNILDIEGFDIVGLFKKILINKGMHHFIAVSHNRDFHGGGPRLKDIYNKLTDSRSTIYSKLKYSTINEFSENDKPALFLKL